ncbi:hypothetical protein L7F22_039509 [Adiantum nelumboides]|nr:hypothetical protein [Adiantum nelumboides]
MKLVVASLNGNSDSSPTPSPPHYNRGGRETFVLAESTSAPLQEFETSSYYEEEQILCWCVRCRGIYQRPRRQCRSHESEYGVFVDAPAPSQRHRPMEYATSLDDEDVIYRRDARQSRTRHGQAIQLLQIDILRQSLPPGLESETSRDYVLLDRLQSLVHMYNCRHYRGWEGGSLLRDGEAPAYDMDADVPLPSHMHGTSRMPDKHMRLLRKSDPKSYHKLKKQYEMDFDKAHEEYNDDNDMDEFINNWLLSQEFLPPTNVFPTSRDEAKHMISKLGLDYNMIHACPNDCILYRGCSTKGYKACPICGDWLKSAYSKHLNKNIYLQHRRFLPEDHSLRQRTQAKHFNGKVESGQCLIAMTPMDWYKKWTEGPLIDPESELASDEDDDRGQGRSTVHGYTNMWSYGQHLRVNRIDRKRQTQDSCIISSFKQQSHASARDTHLIEEELSYVGTIADIYELGYRICKRVDWFRADDYKGARATMRQECLGFWSVDSSKPLRVTREPYILPTHYEQAFFYAAPDSNSPWRQVVPINP